MESTPQYGCDFQRWIRTRGRLRPWLLDEAAAARLPQLPARLPQLPPPGQLQC